MFMAIDPRLQRIVQTDGGWVNDSEPEAEFQETMNKSKAIHPPQ
jgi:anthranilate/para-aminobenzoate synthase component I